MTKVRVKIEPSQAINDVLVERVRQLSEEGYDALHDDTHVDRELARMGVAYALQYVQRTALTPAFEYTKDVGAGEYAPDGWDFKPKNPRRDLVRAAALIVAEIERLDRATVDGGDEHG